MEEQSTTLDVPVIIRVNVVPQSNKQSFMESPAHLTYTTSSALITFDELWEYFLQSKIQRLKPSSLQCYKCDFDRFAKYYSHIKYPGNITIDHAEQYINNRVLTVSPITVNKERRHLRCIWGIAVRKNCLQENVFSQVQPFRQSPITVNAPSAEEVETLLESAASHPHITEYETLRLQAIIRIAAEAGLRNGEIRHLHWEDIDMDTGCIHITCRKDWSTKNGKNRISYILPDTIALLQRMKLARKQFESDMPFQFQHRYALGREFKRIAVRAGIKCTLHDLRRTCATRLAEAGAGIMVTAAILGHSSPHTTQKYYTNISDKAMRQAVIKANS